MMNLCEEIPLTDLTEEPDRFDFLHGVENNPGVVDKVIKMVEIHPSEDNDSTYIYMIWVNEDDTQEVFDHFLSVPIAEDWTMHYQILGDGLIMLTATV